MCHLCSIKYTCYLEVGCLGEFTLKDNLIERYTKVITYIQNTVRGFRLSKRSWTLHIFDKCYLFTVPILIFKSIGADRSHTEYIFTVRERGHRQSEINLSTLCRKHQIVIGFVTGIKHVLLYFCPVNSTRSLVLQTEGLLTTVVAVEILKRKDQIGSC